MQEYNKKEWLQNQNSIKKEFWNYIDTEFNLMQKDTNKLLAFLKVQSRFSSRSIYNALLIKYQNPKGVYLEEYNEYRKKGINVNKGEKGLRLFNKSINTVIPINQDSKTVYKSISSYTDEELENLKSQNILPKTIVNHNLSNVFDITQTDCPVSKYNNFFKFKFSDQEQGKIQDILNEFARKNDIDPSNSKDIKDTIKLISSAISTQNTKISNKDIADFEINCLEQVINFRFGLPISDVDVKVLSDSLQKCNEIPGFKIKDSLKHINKQFDLINNSIEPDLQREFKHTSQYIKEDDISLDELKQSVSIVDLADSFGFEVKQVGNYYTLKKHDSVRIFPSNNTYYRFSTGTGGTNIDFVKNFLNLSVSDSIKYLKERATNNLNNFKPKTHMSQPPTITSKKEDFKLPKPYEGKPSRVFSYLVKTRGIDKKIVSDLMRDKTKSYIYEDEKHNVVFVGLDKKGEPRFASTRSTWPNSNYRGHVKGSDGKVAFFIDNNSPHLVVTEAPIDTMSLMTMLGQEKNDFSYLSLCGVSNTQCLYNKLNENPNIKKITLLLDNDEAGRAADKKIENIIKQNFKNVALDIKKPSIGKDMNEFLLQSLQQNVDFSKSNEQEVIEMK